jgi:hypothetical protein
LAASRLASAAAAAAALASPAAAAMRAYRCLGMGALQRTTHLVQESILKSEEMRTGADPA